MPSEAQQAVSVDANSLVQRLQQLEGRLQTLEARPASSNLPLAPVVGARPAVQAPVSGPTFAANAVAQRLDEFERQQDAQTGSLERLTFAMERLAKRIDDLQRDYEQRLSELEGKLAQPAALPAQAAAPAQGLSATLPSPAATSPSLPPTAIPATATPNVLYERGYAYITAGDYPNAALWLTTLLQRHPKDALADNAHYWLGEVYLVQNNPRAAAQSFRDGLKNFPKGQFVAKNLLKLGVALQKLNQPDLARGAWQKLAKDFPASPEAKQAQANLAQLRISPTTPPAAAR